MIKLGLVQILIFVLVRFLIPSHIQLNIDFISLGMQ